MKQNLLVNITKSFFCASSRHTARWLIVCASVMFIGFGCSDFKKSSQQTLFSKVPSNHSSITFANRIDFDSALEEFKMYNLVTGGGVALGDLNQDGLLDIYFTGTLVPDKLYINQGDLQFEDVSIESGVQSALQGWSTGVVMADLNGDMLLDIYVCKDIFDSAQERRNLLFINIGDGKFEERGKEYGIDDPGYSTSATFFDYDMDGDLDLYIVNHPMNYDKVYYLNHYSDGKDTNAIYTDRLYENIGGEYFRDISSKSGINSYKGYGLSVHSIDFNNDHWPDIYVANDYLGQDFLWINNKDGTFRQSLYDYYSKTPLYSMGSDFADFNNDGLIDHFQVDMMPDSNYRLKNNYLALPEPFYDNLIAQKTPQYSRNFLMLRNRDNTFSEVGFFSGVAKTDWSWSCLFGDLDNDGFKDLFVTNGIEKDIPNADLINAKSMTWQKKLKVNEGRKVDIRNFPDVLMTNYAFRNNGNCRFTNKTKDWGFEMPINSNGAALGDLDNDGDLDLVVNNFNVEASVYQNNTDRLFGRSFLRVKLQGSNLNSHGVGAVVTAYHSGQIQVKRQVTTRGFLSSSDPTLHFGLLNDTIVDSITVHWPQGGLQTIGRIQSNQTLNIRQRKEDYGLAGIEKNTLKNTSFFKTKTSNLNVEFAHKESIFNDFKRDKLLHRKISREGPPIDASDANGDGLQDFYIGGAAGSNGALYLQREDGTFIESIIQPWNEDNGFEDSDALFFDANSDGHSDLYLTSGSNEFGATDIHQQDRLFINDGEGKFHHSEEALPVMITSTSCVVANDFDQDGDLDLFVGGRIFPGNYPLSPRSYLLENDGGMFKDITKEKAPALVNPGMVTAAAWADLDEDGFAELIVVGEWMPISVFSVKNRRFVNVTKEYGLDSTSGWWNTVCTADLDNDGDEDILAGNHGLNSFFQASVSEPLSIYAGDYDNTGTIKPLLFRYVHGVNASFVSLDMLLSEMPTYSNKFLSYSSFSESGLDDLITKEQQKMSYALKANLLSSCVIINEVGTKMSINELPAKAQFAPVYDFLVQDFSKDKVPDLIVVGNSYSNHYSLGNLDAMGGQMFIGQGNGRFSTVEPNVSGLTVRGDVKSIEAVKIGRQGTSVAMIIGINNGESKIIISNSERDLE